MKEIPVLKLNKLVQSEMSEKELSKIKGGAPGNPCGSSCGSNIELNINQVMKNLKTNNPGPYPTRG